MLAFPDHAGMHGLPGADDACRFHGTALPGSRPSRSIGRRRCAPPASPRGSAPRCRCLRSRARCGTTSTAGSRRSAGGRHVDQIDHHQRAHAGLHDEVERLDRAIDDALDERARAVHGAHAGQPRRIDRAGGFRDGLAAHPQQARQIDAARVRRRRIEAIEGIDRALPIHRGAWRQRARPMPRSCARTKPAPPLPRPGLAAGHRQQSAAPGPRCDPGGIEWSNGVFAQTFGQCRGEGAIEFSFSEKGFDGGSDGHISPHISLNFRYYSDDKAKVKAKGAP